MMLHTNSPIENPDKGSDDSINAALRCNTIPPLTKAHIALFVLFILFS